MIKRFPALLFSTFGLAFLPLAALAHAPAEDMRKAAGNFLAALSPEQKQKAVYKFSDEERFDWHFVPKPRKGLPIAEMSPSQRALATALLNSGLSHDGFAKASTIISLEQILYDLENKSAMRNAELYYFTVFGEPGSGPWGWRVEGHHLSLNFCVRGEEVLAVTPAFMGTNPAEVKDGPRKGLRVLGSEEDLARKLAQSLNDDQRKQAIYTNTAPRDIITGNARLATKLDPQGIAVAAFNPDQEKAFEALLREYFFRYRPEITEPQFKAALANRSQLHFAWAGPTEPGKGHYYRIQGADFLLEYDNTQNNANHAHTVWRNLKNDFGGDLLRAHYEQTPHAK